MSHFRVVNAIIDMLMDTKLRSTLDHRTYVQNGQSRNINEIHI